MPGNPTAKPLNVHISGIVIGFVAAASLLLAFFAMIGGWGFDSSQDAAMAAKCDYATVARAATRKAYPDYDTNRRIALIDRGAHVEMHYPWPEGILGGSPIIHIEKETCRVTAISRTQ